MPELNCFACEREPVQQCPRCGRPYCEDHGEDFCGVCLEPSSGIPSFTLYRGSLLALLVGAMLAVWLILQPTSDASESALRPTVATATPQGSAGALTTLPAGATIPAVTSQAAAASGTARPATTVATGTARPATTAGAGTPVATAAGGATTTPGANAGVYVVVAGDSLSGICSDKIRRPGAMTVNECVEQIKVLNGLTSDSISIGQQLRVPQ